MPIVEKRIFRINDYVDNIDFAQLCFEPVNDPDLGFRMWCGKDLDGNTTKWLAKDEDARVNVLGLNDGLTDENCNWSLGHIPLSSSSAEWTDAEALGGGEVSLLALIKAASTSNVSLDDAYNNGRVINADEGPVSIFNALGENNILELVNAVDHYSTLKISQSGDSQNLGWYEPSWSIYLTGSAPQGQTIFSDQKLTIGIMRNDEDPELSIIAQTNGDDIDAYTTVSAVVGGDTEITSKATTLVEALSTISNNTAYIELTAQDLSASTILLKAESISANDNAEILFKAIPNGSGAGIITIDADRVLFGQAEIRNLRIATYGTSLPSASYDTGTVTVDWDDGPAQAVTATGNITALSMSAPIGIGLGLTLSIAASGGAITIGGITNVSWADGSDLSGAAAMTIPSGDWLDIHLWYNGTTYHGCVLPEAV